jgi:riboflavin transporter FmnP
MSRHEEKLELLKRKSKKSVLTAILAALFIYPLAGFMVGLGSGLFWFLLCAGGWYTLGSGSAMFLIPIGVLVVPAEIYSQNKKRELELDLKYGRDE